MLVWTARVTAAALVVIAGLSLAGCQGGSSSFGNLGNPFESSSPPAAATGGRASISASDIVGRWGLAAYHRDQDRARTEQAAQGQCRQPYVIGGGQAGGVMMLTHDNPNVVENLIKVGPDGRTFIGPGDALNQEDDREVVSFDGRVLILRWISPDVAGRYGTMVLVRCGVGGAPARTSSSKPPPTPR